MELTPREKDKLLIFTAALLAERRRAKGLKLNYPEAVALIKNAPHPEEGKKLIDYLLSKETESKLAFSDSAQIPVRDDVARPETIPDFSSIKAMAVDYYQVAAKMEEAARYCQKLLVSTHNQYSW